MKMMIGEWRICRYKRYIYLKKFEIFDGGDKFLMIEEEDDLKI